MISKILLSLRSLWAKGIYPYTRHQLAAGTVPNSICRMGTQREISAASIWGPEQTLSSLFLRCVSGNAEIMDFRESLIKFIQKKTSIIMSAIMARELTAELDTQHANTYFSAFHCIEVFFQTKCFHTYNNLLVNTHWDWTDKRHDTTSQD